MTLDQLENQIRSKGTFLCVGLDTDLEKIPGHLLQQPDPIFAFNKAIIDATAPYCVAYKPNTAFFEAYGVKGWEALERTVVYLNQNYPDHLIIADAKRGDIGNTSTRYAKAFFEEIPCDALTIAPYMGRDSVEPFLEFEGKYAVLLALTSNPGAFDFQTLPIAGQQQLYLEVLEKTQQYKNADRLMYVVGATKAEFLTDIRKVVPEAFLLIPGVGAQGGSLEEVCRYGMNKRVGLLINSSRGIIYASQGADFAQRAGQEAATLQAQMNKMLN
ncbi:orotidine-5'-phosphate decarboxylase [Robiginitalea myxolifaciens]|uniref:Orotidine 5'-phosphate decarboxylase n=1 Tax=Robiginitalea myxolifaciens TaxID=400055 RepID=A0A1I6H9U1_9FLAO|nr:orotidine-5'-phosphate decarboxylase [Robiginitalea myxolifaciens]SFR51299.1 orotidine-5'-phosphate decarboxylase [Robiginitalea myxolifaciens]